MSLHFPNKVQGSITQHVLGDKGESVRNELNMADET